MSLNFFKLSLLGVLGFVIFTEPALAQFGGGELESRLAGLTSALTYVILPAFSVIGLVYAGIMAASGDESAKQRMKLVIMGSIVGFLAAVIIAFVKAKSGA